jgi:hypothetical protein
MQQAMQFTTFQLSAGMPASSNCQWCKQLSQSLPQLMLLLLVLHWTRQIAQTWEIQQLQEVRKLMQMVCSNCAHSNVGHSSLLAAVSRVLCRTSNP